MTRSRAIYPLSRCCVPFCTHTSRTFAPGHEWVCRDHWRLIDPELKRLRTRMVKRYVREGRVEKGAGVYNCQRHSAWLTLGGWWRRAKRQAIERAAGIGG